MFYVFGVLSSVESQYLLGFGSLAIDHLAAGHWQSSREKVHASFNLPFSKEVQIDSTIRVSGIDSGFSTLPLAFKHLRNGHSKSAKER